MFETFKNAFRAPDLRKKLFYTLFILIIFRIGNAIVVPFLDPTAIQSMADSVASAGFLGYLDILSGGAFSSGSILALSITPYINASIIIQLLTIAIPPLERLAKDGESGRKKIGKITRYVTMGLALVQAFGFYTLLRNKYNVLDSSYVNVSGGITFEEILVATTIILMLTAGAAVIVYLGERINDKGIGNGISIILFAGIVSRGPQAVNQIIRWWELGLQGDTKYFFFIPGMILIFIAVIVFIVIMNNAERRIPVQYAKRVVGRKVYGGQSTHIPIKVAMSGVMPIIFASAILSLPQMLYQFFGNNATDGAWAVINSIFSPSGWLYALLYFILIIAFNYFYIYTQYNPVEIANNIRKNNGAIPGIRPGKPTST
ncbi:MAG: preprotein translocase subunit SecY, partial [Oscillospiraceae bacterium]